MMGMFGIWVSLGAVSEGQTAGCQHTVRAVRSVDATRAPSYCVMSHMAEKHEHSTYQALIPGHPMHAAWGEQGSQLKALQ